MDEMTFIGYLISSAVTLGAFIAVIMKFTQPINELKIVIQRLNDTIDFIQEENKKIALRLNAHGQEIDLLNKEVSELKIKIEHYYGPK